MNKRLIGREGERIAENYLKKSGYSVLSRNYQKRAGEIDLIARDLQTGETVFIEVKTRSSLNFGYPEEAVNHKKLMKMNTVANLWLMENNKNDATWRIDVISILKKEDQPHIHHLKNITG